MKFTIQGAVPSKSNSYKLTNRGKFASMYKAKGLKAYEKMFYLQVPAEARGVELKGLLKVFLSVYYTSNRLDLDNSAKIILDCMQDAKVMKNDRQVVELHMYKHIDKKNPRVEIEVKEIL